MKNSNSFFNNINRTIFYIVISVVSLTTINSCSIQKRHYTKGFHVEWKNQKVATHDSFSESITYEVNSTPIESIKLEKIDTNVITQYQKPTINPISITKNTIHSIEQKVVHRNFQPTSKKHLKKFKHSHEIQSKTTFAIKNETKESNSNIPLLILTSTLIAIMFLALVSLALLLPIGGILLFMGLLWLSQIIFEQNEPDDDNFWGKAFIWAKNIVVAILTLATIAILAITLPLSTFILLMTSTIITMAIIIWAFNSVFDFIFGFFE